MPGSIARGLVVGRRRAACAPLPESAGRPDEHSDLPKQPQRSQQPDVHVFFSIAGQRAKRPRGARPVKAAACPQSSVAPR